jgi:patatin-like phospholipase/acyl hydrolase
MVATYVDGGIISNNPALELMQEIQTWNTFNQFKVIAILS